MKKILAMLLAVVMIATLAVGCGKQDDTAVDPADATVDWSEYDALIEEIRTTTDFEARVGLMHEAEDMLMDTGAILPLYYYNDLFMMKDTVDGVYYNLYGTKYFQYATVEGSDVLKINLSSEPDYLDPALNSSVDGACLAAMLFGGLYIYDKDGNVVPNFAEDCKVSEDGKTYTFTLRDGLKWSNGDVLDANDFVYSWNRAVAPETAADYSYMYAVVDGYNEGALNISASEDGKTFTVNLYNPCAYFMDLAAFPTFFPVHQESVEAADGWETNPGKWCQEAGFVTAGPFTVKSWAHESSMVVVKNDNWWDAENVKLSSIEMMLSADDTAIFAAYNAGDLDFIDSVPNDEIQNIKDQADFYIVDNLGTYYVSFNVNSPLFDGLTELQAKNLRKAIACVIDRDYIIETCGQTEQKPANAFIPEGMMDGNGGIFKSDAYEYPYETGYYYATDYDANYQLALDYLDEAGLLGEDGKINIEFDFEYLTNEGSGHVAVAECIQSDLAQLGINMTIRQCDWNTFLDERKAGNYDIARNGWLADFNDPINMLEMWTTDSGNNDCQLGR